MIGRLARPTRRAIPLFAPGPVANLAHGYVRMPVREQTFVAIWGTARNWATTSPQGAVERAGREWAAWLDG